MQTSPTWTEEACVSWALADPRATLDHGIEIDWFSDLRCRAAWEAIRDLAERGVEPDGMMPFLVAEQMQPGGPGELVVSWLVGRFACHVLDQPNWRNWSARLRELAIERKRREAASKLAETLRRAEGDDEQESAVAAFQGALAELPAADADDPATLFDVLKDAVSSLQSRVEARDRGEQANLGVPTGVSWLDARLGGGWPRGCVSVLAGRTSHGKSTISQIAALEANRQGFGVHYFCMEDGAEMFGARILAQTTGLSVGKFFAGDCPAVTQIVADVDRQADKGAMRRFLFETKRLSIEQLIARVNRYRVSNRTAVVFIDYLALVPLPGDAERHQEVEQAVTRLQEAAIEQGVAYVVLHQLNRTFAGRQNKQPMLSDLRDSGAIEERAAVVVFAHRPNVDDGATNDGGGSEVDDMNLVLAKNKFGPRNCLAPLRVNFARYSIVRADAY